MSAKREWKQGFKLDVTLVKDLMEEQTQLTNLKMLKSEAEDFYTINEKNNIKIFKP